MTKKKLLTKKKINCKNIETKLKTKNDVLTLLGMGTYGVAFLGCLNDLCSKKISVKFVTIIKQYNYDNTHPAVVEYLIGKQLSNLVDDNITPHINYVYKNLICDINKIKKLKTIKYSEWFNTRIYDSNNKMFYKDYEKKYLKDIMIIFNEIANTDFKKYVINRYETKNPVSFIEHLSTFFCFCYTMSIIVFNNPNYRHNDIKPNNLLIKLTKNYNKNNYIKYIIFGQTFYIPQTKFIIKLHDFDFSNSTKFPNRKILNYKGLFKEINATPFTNPVYDLHEYINFFIRDFKNYIRDTSIEKYFYSLFSEGTFGSENTYTRRYKLTNYKINGQNINLSDEQKYNYIPKDMKTPSELILMDKVFDIFKTLPKNGKIIKTYNSNIPHPKYYKSLLKRKDMFNVLLN